MPKIPDPYHVETLSDGRLRFSLTAESGLPNGVWRSWRRKSFRSLPDDLAGQRFPSSEGEAKRACRALIEYLKKEGKPENVGTAKKPLVPWLLAFWTPESEYVRRKAVVEKLPHSGRYIKGSRRDIEKYAAPYPPFASVTVGGLTKKMVREWMLWLSENGLSGRKVNLVKQAVRVAINDAWKNEEIPTFPFLGISDAYHTPKKKGVLTPAEIERVEAAHVTDPFRRLAVLLGARCGMRRGEVRGLQWGDIDGDIITVRHNWVDGDGLKNPKRKGGLVRENSRSVLVIDSVREALEAARKKAKFTGGGDFVIQSLRRRGKVVSVSYCKHALAGELAAIGLPEAEQKRRNLTFHGLRHTFVTLGRLAGLTDAEIQAMAGWTGSSRPLGTAERMMENYSHVEQVLDFAAIKAKLEKKKAVSGRASRKKPPYRRTRKGVVRQETFKKKPGRRNGEKPARAGHPG